MLMKSLLSFGNRNSNVLFLSFVLLCICLYSCNGKHNTKGDSPDNITVSDSMKFIRKADAKEFLPSWSKKNVIIYQIPSEPNSLHPTNGTAALRTEINLWSQGFIMQEDLQHLDVMPGVVKSMPEVSSDKLNYTFELRDEPKWDDGKQLSVEDIIFTFKANKCPLMENPDTRESLMNIKDIIKDKNNNRKFTMVMKKIFNQNKSMTVDIPLMERTFVDGKDILSKYSFVQFDDEKFKADKEKELNDWANDFNSAKFGRDPKYFNGLGMYKITKWDEGQAITLEKKQNHWTKGSKNIFEAAYADKIILKINRDPNSLLLEFKSQDIDASTSISTKVLLELQKDSSFNANYNSQIVSTFNYAFIDINMKPDAKHQKLFTDKRVRRAMALLTPVDEMNKILNYNVNKRIAGPVSPMKKEYNTDLKLLPFDVEQAKKLLDEAGWKDTDGDNIRDKIIDGKKVQFSFEMSFPNVAVEYNNAIQLIADAMYKAGVKCNPNPVEPNIYHQNLVKHNFDMIMSSWQLNYAPEDYSQIWHTKAWSENGGNYGGFGTPQTDALIDSIKYSIDPEKYIPMVRRFQTIVYDEQPYIFTFASMKRIIVHKRFGNCEMYFDRPEVLLNNLKLLQSGNSK